MINCPALSTIGELLRVTAEEHPSGLLITICDCSERSSRFAAFTQLLHRQLADQQTFNQILTKIAQEVADIERYLRTNGPGELHTPRYRVALARSLYRCPLSLCGRTCAVSAVDSSFPSGCCCCCCCCRTIA